MSKVLGMDCKAYHSSTAFDGATNDAAAATWNEMTEVRDVTVTLSNVEIDVSDRSSTYKLYRAGQHDISVNVTQLWNTSDTYFALVLDAWEGRSSITLAFMDGDESVAGKEGPASNWVVLDFEGGEDLDGAAISTYSVKPHSYPEWYISA